MLCLSLRKDYYLHTSECAAAEPSQACDIFYSLKAAPTAFAVSLDDCRVVKCINKCPVTGSVILLLFSMLAVEQLDTVRLAY